MTERLSDAAVEIRAQHEVSPWGRCHFCAERWPCAAIQLADDHDALAGEVKRLEKEATRPTRITCGASHPDPDVEQRTQALRANDGHPTGPMGGCGYPMWWGYAFRCVECGRWFHKECILKHFASDLSHAALNPTPEATE